MDKKKLENIWYHYKSFILMGIVLLVIASSLLPPFNHPQKTALQAVFIGNYVKEEKQMALQHDATKYILGKSDSKQIIRMDFWATAGGTLDSDTTVQKKLMAMIATENVDILVMDKKSFLALAREGTFLPLNPFERKFSKGVQFLSSMENGQEHLYGIEIPQNPQLEKTGYQTKDKVLGIAANSKNQKMAVKAAEELVHD